MYLPAVFIYRGFEDAILILYPLFYVPNDAARVGLLSYKKQLLLRSPQGISVAAMAAAVMLVPQLMYWKYVVGRFIHYSYGEEGFIYWKNPK